MNAQYPQDDNNAQVRIRFKAPHATKMRVTFWSGEKTNMEMHPDGFWTLTTKSMPHGLHYYTHNVEDTKTYDPANTVYFGGNKLASVAEFSERCVDF